MLAYLPHIYFITGLLEIAGEYFEQDWLVYLTKPLLMPILITYVALAAFKTAPASSKLLIASLIGAWGGDVFLMLLEVDERFFLLGLGSFLIAQLLYVIIFMKDARKAGGKSILRSKPMAAFPFVLAYAMLLLLLIPRLGDLVIPVVIYATVITAMVITSLNRYNKVAERSFLLVFFGAAIFMLSDSLIAVNKFYQPLSFARVGIMSTYIFAQFLIVEGCVQNFRGESR